MHFNKLKVHLQLFLWTNLMGFLVVMWLSQVTFQFRQQEGRTWGQTRPQQEVTVAEQFVWRGLYRWRTPTKKKSTVAIGRGLKAIGGKVVLPN